MKLLPLREPTRKDISKEELETMLLTLSPKEIGVQINMAEGTVRYRMKQFGIKTPNHPYKTKPKKIKKSKKDNFNPHISNYQKHMGECKIPNKFFDKLIDSAHKRHHNVDISIHDIWHQYIKQNGKCYLTGRPISFMDNTASVDRIDNTKGYIVGNIGICWKRANMVKWKLSLEQLEEITKEMTETFENNKKMENSWEFAHNSI